MENKPSKPYICRKLKNENKMEIIRKLVPYGNADVKINKRGEVEVLYRGEGYVLNLPYRLKTEKSKKMKIEFGIGKNYLHAITKEGKRVIIELIGIVGR